LIRRFHEAKQNGKDDVLIWGTGRPRREFLHVDDLADACIHLLQLDDPPDWINVGAGTDVTIHELAEMIQETVGYSGRLRFDPSKPDGMLRKVMDVSKMEQLGWKARIDLASGLKQTYQSFLQEQKSASARL
jgi:GDP-L-fucose synthase